MVKKIHSKFPKNFEKISEQFRKNCKVKLSQFWKNIEKNSRETRIVWQ